ncbi:uncharacterized protein LOC123702526 [Colias croceus]|uniref:uncharacterized protein LOC123702526 n=1 Tax=Colias crocea TaxID=72248 RepID=UPI001E27A6B3|nr:uncharacterized protein LOC123702526 [Colias croceus]XP_045506259.1 uncharacterized protein LOC123702526 [Colias croceus]
MLIKDPIHRDALVSAIEENGKNWEEVAVTVKQPIEVCQKGFDELVKECKKEDNKAKKAILGTGGGPPNPAYKDDPLNSIKKLIEPQIDGLFTIYDSDALLMSQYQLSLAEEERIKPIEENIIEFTSDIAPESFETTPDKPTSCTPVQSRVQILRKKKEAALSSHRGNKSKTSVKDSFQQLSEAKLELVELQKKCLEIELKHKEKFRK